MQSRHGATIVGCSLIAGLLLSGCMTSGDATPGRTEASSPQRQLVTLTPLDGRTGATRELIRQALSRDALRVCVREEREIDAGKIQQQLDENALKIRRDELEADEQSLEIRRSQVNARSQESVDGFNNAIRAHSMDIDEYNRAVDEARRRDGAVGSLVNSFNTTCGGRSYYQDDMDVVLLELGPASVRRAADSLFPSVRRPGDNLFPPAPARRGGDSLIRPPDTGEFLRPSR